jgi:hypothetical protein
MKRITKSKVLVIGCTLLLAGVTLGWLNYAQIRARLHLGVYTLGGISDIRYASVDEKELPPAHYIGFTVTDAACLESIIDHLSLTKLDIFLYAGKNPPSWWPEELRRQGTWDEIRRLGADLRGNGDLITYRYSPKNPDLSAGKTYVIQLYYYPKTKRAFYVKRWMGVFAV